MPGLGTILDLLKHLPAVLELVRRMRGDQTSEQEEQTRAVIEAMRKNVEIRQDDQEREIARLRTELHDVRTLAAVLQVWVYLGFTIAVIALALVIWALVR